jgi:general secretion pathway protein G
MRRKRVRGFTLIEVLVVVGIVGILSALVIANYLDGLQKARQKRTMADIRSIANAWEARAVEARAYNAAGQTTPPATYTMPATTLTQAQLASLLTPTYMRVLPNVDGWSTGFDFAVEFPLGGAPATHYAIRSAGGDQTFEASYTAGPTEDFDCDIVFADGNFVVYPRVR